MRCPGGSPKITSWHGPWWDSGGRQRLKACKEEGCCELASGSGPGHGEQQVPIHLEVGRAAGSSLTAGLAFVLRFRNLTTEPFVHPGAALWTRGLAPMKEGELSSRAPGNHRCQEEHRYAREEFLNVRPPPPLNFGNA